MPKNSNSYFGKKVDAEYQKYDINNHIKIE